MTQTALIDLHYMPSIPYMAAWHYYNRIIIEAKENFTKQSYRNRCEINTANGIKSLIVPVQKGNRYPILEIRIDTKQNWAKNHWGAIQSAYGKSPFFEFYGESIRQVLFKGHRFLLDLNLALLELLLKELSIDFDLYFTQFYHKMPPHEIVDLRSEIHPKKSTANLGFYKSVVYIQTFGEKFLEDLSIIDLLFNEGPNAKNVIHASGLKDQNN